MGDETRGERRGEERRGEERGEENTCAMNGTTSI
jgi:hypothetical protein